MATSFGGHGSPCVVQASRRDAPGTYLAPGFFLVLLLLALPPAMLLALPAAALSAWAFLLSAAAWRLCMAAVA
jgi:hypothetical protein